MGTAFSSSLFGLAGSLVLGFLDLQASQAQNPFYTDLEDWMTTMTELSASEIRPLDTSEMPTDTPASAEIKASLDKLSAILAEGGGTGSGSSRAHPRHGRTRRGIQGLVKHMRAEQKLIREWVESQSEQQSEIRDLLTRMVEREEREKV